MSTSVSDSASDSISDRYVYFLDDDAFQETDRPGFRRRVIDGEFVQLWFWRIAGGATGSVLHKHDENEQFGIIVRGRLDFRIGDPESTERHVLARRRHVPRAGRHVARRQHVHRRRRGRGVLDPRRLLAPRADVAKHEVAASMSEPTGTRRGASPSTSAARSPTPCCSTRRAARRRRQDAHDAGRSARRRQGGGASRCWRRPPCEPAEITRTDRPRHDAGHQRADRGQDGAGRGRHHRRLRRHAADPRRAPLRHVRPADRVPGPPVPASLRVRDRRAHDRRRRGARRRRARRRSTRIAAQLARRKVEAVGVCLLHTPTPTRPTSGSSPTTCASELGRAGVRVERGVAADPRVPADGDDRVQRGDDAGRRALPRRAPDAGSPTSGFGGRC